MAVYASSCHSDAKAFDRWEDPFGGGVYRADKVKKERQYSDTHFSADVLRDAVALLKEVAAREKVELPSSILKVDHEDASWHYDSLEEFLADYRRSKSYAYLSIWGGGFELAVAAGRRSANVAVRATGRAAIETVFDVFEKNAASSRLEPDPESALTEAKPIVFIGHGRSVAWRDLKDHLHDKHGFQIEAFETGARAGHTVRDILEEMVDKSSFALLVLTGEDEQADGQLRARQNVIHEAGLFQGRLGFARAVLLLEDGVEEFSNVQGVQHIKFGRNNIKETFGEVLATLRREFGPSR